MALVYIILGGNSNDKACKLEDAVAFLASDLGVVSQVSAVYETASWGYESESTYYNQVVVLNTHFSPMEVLDITQEIECRLGRLSKTVGGVYSDRPIDIDILFYDQEVVEEECLIIPHVHIAARRFVLVPLCDVCPEFIHPQTKKSMQELLLECPDDLMVKRITKES